MENNKINFSWAYAFWGVFGFFFHRKNIKKLPFWKSAGIDILVWGTILGIINRLTNFIPGDFFIDFVISIIMMALWGFVGAWRFNKYKKDDYDYSLWKRREKYGIITGIILYCLVAFGSYYITSIYENTENTKNSVNNITYIYFENGYVCDKFYQVSANHINVETNTDVEYAVKKIHVLCPGDVYTTDTVDVKTIIEVYPQLNTWDFNAHFIHTYPTENGNTAYIFLKKIK